MDPVKGRFPSCKEARDPRGTCRGTYWIDKDVVYSSRASNDVQPVIDSQIHPAGTWPPAGGPVPQFQSVWTPGPETGSIRVIDPTQATTLVGSSASLARETYQPTNCVVATVIPNGGYETRSSPFYLLDPILDKKDDNEYDSDSDEDLNEEHSA